MRPRRSAAKRDLVFSVHLDVPPHEHSVRMSAGFGNAAQRYARFGGNTPSARKVKLEDCRWWNKRFEVVFRQLIELNVVQSSGTFAFENL